MSGVVALVSLDGTPVAREVAEEMLQRAAHRGDRHPVMWAGTAAALGHVHRARTPEAEDESLPECDASGRYWLTWDGRLDNRAELAERLGIRPEVARVLPDASYVLRAFARWDADAPEQLLGDWALVVYDRIRHRVIAARDPIGLRPLFYAERGGQLAVCSEPQQLFAGDFVTPEPDLDYVHRFLAHAVTQDGSTHLRGVREVDPGTILVADERGSRVRAFWTHPRTTAIQPRSFEECVEAFEEVFDQAIRTRVRSNMPVSVLLSGGIDSSHVAAVASDYTTPITVNAYAPGGARTDERHYAEIVAKTTGSHHFLVDVSDCWTLSARHLPDATFDQPHHPGQGAGQWRAAQVAAEQGAGVVLDGIGGDEWFTGAPFFLAEALLHRHPLQAWRIARAAPRSIAAPRLLVREAYRGLAPLRARRLIHRAIGRGDVTRFDFSSYVSVDDGWDSTPAVLRDLSPYDRDGYYRSTWRIHRRVNLPDMYWRDRQIDQPLGLERRSPLNDLRVVELLASIPEWTKRFHGRRKDILREALARRVPGISDRLDHGLYDELFLLGLRERESERVAAAVEAAAALPGVRADVMRADVEDFLGSRHGYWSAPWRAISLGMWLRQLETLRRASRTADRRSPAGQAQAMEV